MAVATGQITIIDYNDALTLTGFVSASKAKTQMYNPDNATYNPDWSVSPYMVLTPSLFKLGSATDIIADAAVQSVSWYESSAPTTKLTANATYGISGAKSHILTIKTNTLAGLSGKDYICEVVYKDPTTLLELTHKMDITLTRVVNGSGIADAVATAIDGIVFKNGDVASLRIEALLWRGSVTDNTSVTYTWFQKDTSVSTDQGGGIGWRKLTADVAGKYSGWNASILTVFPGAVAGIATFKVGIKDTDSGSNTYNTTFWDVCTIADQSDPIQVSVVSSGGDVFKNGVGSTTLTAKVFRAGVEIDAGATTYSYRWYKYDQNGDLVSGWGGATNYKTGKTLLVGDADVAVKATFVVEVI